MFKFRKNKKEDKKDPILVRILIIINILFIIGCCIFYGSRLCYFYMIEHPRVKNNSPLISVINLDKNVVTVGDGLYEATDDYIFKGKSVNNYVKYSGRIWRIVSINKDSQVVKLVTDDSQTSLVWGIDMDYENSYIRSWLNGEENNMKSFYQGLSNTDIITLTNTCIDILSSDGITSCNDTVQDKVGLLSAFDYQLAGGENSYLNIDEYWWLSNTDEDNTAWYVYANGSVNNNTSSGKVYFSYGVRPVITISGNTTVISGSGTSDDPINLDATTANILENKYVGEYITYSGYNWRIIEKDTDYVKVVMDGFIKDGDVPLVTSFGNTNYCSSDKGMCNYLNTTFYETLDNKDYILSHKYLTGKYDRTSNYDFNKISDYQEELNVGLLQLGELFVTEQSKYFLGSRSITSDNDIYQVFENGNIYAGSTSEELRIRPTLYLKNDIVIVSGSGTKTRPFVLK